MINQDEAKKSVLKFLELLPINLWPNEIGQLVDGYIYIMWNQKHNRLSLEFNDTGGLECTGYIDRCCVSENLNWVLRGDKWDCIERIKIYLSAMNYRVNGFSGSSIKHILSFMDKKT